MGPNIILVSSWVFVIVIKKCKAWGIPFRSLFLYCGPRPPTTGTPGVLAKMQIPGLQLRSAGSEFLGVGFGYLYFKQAF